MLKENQSEFDVNHPCPHDPELNRIVLELSRNAKPREMVRSILNMADCVAEINEKRGEVAPC